VAIQSVRKNKTLDCFAALAMTADVGCSEFPYPRDAPDLREKLRTPTTLNIVCENGDPQMHQEPIGRKFSLASGQTCPLLSDMLVWTDREEGARLISCREAEPYEREAYYRAYPPN